MAKVTVVNKRTYKGEGTYIGRPSVFGNPYTVSLGRDKCIDMYKEHAKKQYNKNPEFKAELLKLLNKFNNGEDITLICWCAPLKCHGDVLADFIVRNAK